MSAAYRVDLSKMATKMTEPAKRNVPAGTGNMILEQARLSPQMRDEGYFLVATIEGPQKLTLLRDSGGFLLAFDEDVDETGEMVEGAPSWRVNVSLDPE